MSDADSKENEEEVKPVETEAAESVVDENGPVNVDHQDNDLDLKTVKKFIIGSFVVTLVFFVLMLIVLKFYKNDFEEERGVATEETRQIPGKDDSLLQTRPLMDLAEYNQAEEVRLTTAGTEEGTTVIPVEAAKELMLSEHAFPTAATTSQEEKEAVVDVRKEKEVAKTGPETSATAAAPAEVPATQENAVEEEAEPAPDPAMVAAGKTLWKTNCLVCHSGTKTAIGPNIEKAYGSMRKLENHDPILMDTAYIINSLNNPAEHIAKGYPPVMTSFKESLPDDQKAKLAAYLQSQGKPIMKAKPKPIATAVPAPVVKPTAVPTAAPAVEAPEVPEVKPTAVPATPAAPVAPEKPAAPAPEKGKASSGVIFI
ncbi:cytochrome c [Kiritimatiellaeota bacterium B1221]|nr:cytochrome c [Kiritimatiellaeota bacterium B1221]